MTKYKVQLAGVQEPLLFDVGGEELFQAYRRWLEQDVQFKANGIVISHGPTTLAINFAQVATIKVEQPDTI